MINHIKINNFKSFSSESINFGKITLLTGLNSSGKSTVITSLLLPMQMDDNVLNMNSDYFQLGTFGDILHQWANTDELKIEYSTSEGDSFLLFKYNSVLENESQITCDASSNLNLITYPNIVYISAQRIVPTLYYERSNITSKNNTSDIHGSNSISLLAAKKIIK
ncbi:AAA family ATPase [Aeromonas caviae]